MEGTNWRSNRWEEYRVRAGSRVNIQKAVRSGNAISLSFTSMTGCEIVPTVSRISTDQERGGQAEVTCRGEAQGTVIPDDQGNIIGMQFTVIMIYMTLYFWGAYFMLAN